MRRAVIARADDSPVQATNALPVPSAASTARRPRPRGRTASSGVPSAPRRTSCSSLTNELSPTGATTSTSPVWVTATCAASVVLASTRRAGPKLPPAGRAATMRSVSWRQKTSVAPPRPRTTRVRSTSPVARVAGAPKPPGLRSLTSTRPSSTQETVDRPVASVVAAGSESGLTGSRTPRRPDRVSSIASARVRRDQRRAGARPAAHCGPEADSPVVVRLSVPSRRPSRSTVTSLRR